MVFFSMDVPRKNFWLDVSNEAVDNALWQKKERKKKNCMIIDSIIIIPGLQ